MKNIILKCALACIAAIATASPALATTQTFDFKDGHMFPRFYEPGDVASNYKFRTEYDLSDLQLSIDVVEGTARVFGDFDGDIRAKDGSILGTSTASLDIAFTGLTTSGSDYQVGSGFADIMLLGVEGDSTSSGEYTFDLQFNDGSRDIETIDVFGGFANVGAGHHRFGDIAGTAFNFILRTDGAFDIWVKSLDGRDFTISNDPFNLHGDIHGTAEVPEPATMLLLGSGLFGASLRRRKAKQA